MDRFLRVGFMLLTVSLFGLAVPVAAQTSSAASSPAVSVGDRSAFTGIVDARAGEADLAITRTVDNPTPAEGGTVRYTVVLTNDGPDRATNVQVNHVLPAGVTFVSSSSTRGVYVHHTGVWALAEIADGASETLTITARIDAGTDGSRIVDSARVAYLDQADLNPRNDSSDVSLTVRGIERVDGEITPPDGLFRAGNADLGVVKTVDVAVPAEGDTVSFTVALTNNGPDTANNIQVNDLVPTGLTYLSSSVTAGVYIPGSGIWVLSSLANGAADTLTINVTVDSGTGATTITNTATIVALDETDSNSSNDSDSASVTVQGADLAVTKTVNNDFPNEGETITYTVVLDNNGPNTATNVQVTDLLPGGLTFSSSSQTQGTYASGTGIWVVGTVSASGSATLTLNATVDAGTGGSTIVNTASVTASDQADNVTGNNSDSDSLTVQTLDLAVTKSVDDSFPNEGDTVDYTVVLTNNGPDAATNVEVTDALPTGVTYVSSSATQGTYSSGTGIWSVPGLANGASDTLTISASVDTATGGSTIVNTATLTDSDQADSNSGNDSDTASLTVQSVDLAVVKTVDDAAPSEGGTIDYTVVVTNNGPDAATTVEVTDVLPTGVTYSSSSATQGSYASGTGIWSVGTVANAASDTLTITATVDVGTGGTTIVNTATATGSDQADSNSANDSDTADITVQEADLAVTKSVDDTFPNEGDTINYTVTLTNNGPDATTNVAVTDSLPAGVTYVSSSATQGTYSSGTGIWSVASLANGASDTLTITVTVDAGTNGQTIDNTASVTASDQPDNNPADNSDSASFLVQSADLAVTKTVDDAFPNEGGTINYTVVLTNNGPDTATNIDVTDALPTGVTYSSHSTTQGSYASGTGIWSLTSLANAASDTLILTATVDAGTNGQTIHNTATVTASDQGDGTPANDSDTASILVQSVDLAVTKTVDNNFPNEGDTINYTVVLDNVGSDTATNVEVTDNLPAGVTYSSSSATQGSYDSGTGIWSVASLASSGSDTLTITATIDTGTNGQTIVNTATVTASDQADGNSANDSDDASLLVQSVDLTVAKTVDDTFPNVGDTINYSVVATNNGPDVATNVEVTDVLPAGVTYVSSSATQGSYSSGTGIWSVPSIGIAASDTLTITATIDPGTNGQTIVNIATATGSDQADSNPANDSDSASLLVQSVDLALTKAVDDTFPNEGDSVNYTIVLSNGGPDAASNIEVTDILPGGVTFVTSSATQGSYVPGTGIWSLAGLSVGASDTLVITATINAGTGGSTIVNNATVTDSDQEDSDSGNDFDSASLLVQTIDLAVTKTVNDPTPNEGGTITYTVVLDNNGTDTATSVELTDLLPPGVTFVSSTETQGTYTSGTGLWDVGTLASSGSATLTLTATVDAGTGGSTITNTASVTNSDQADANLADNTDSVDIVVQGADLEVTKTVDDSFPNEGDPVVFTIVLGNNGPNTATNVQLTDLLPSGVTYVSHTVTQGTYVSGTGIWSVGSVPNGASRTLTITATVDVGTNGSTIVNIATVTASDQADGDPGNNSDSASLTVQSVDLTVVKTVDDDFPNEGDTVNYTVVLTNNGPDTATNVEVTDALPSGVTYVSSSATQGTYSSGTGIWSVASIAASASDTLTLTVTTDAGSGGSTIVNTATATASDQADSNPANDSDSASLTVQSIDLAVVKTVSDAAPSESDSIDYTVVVTNNGPHTATNVELTDALPAGVTYSSSSATQGSYSSGTGIWSLASVANGASDTLTITVIVDVGTGGTSIVNSAAVTSTDQTDSNPANDSDSATINVQAADLEIVKTVNNPSPAEGGTIIYTLVLSNNGPDATTNVEVTDILPTGVTYFSSSATQGSYNSGTGVWTVGSVPNAGSATLTITATVDLGTGALTIVNTATVTASDQPDNNPANDSDTADITVQGADLAIVKTVDDPTPHEGGSITYTVALTNNGPDTATNIQVNDLLPAGVSYDSHSTTSGVYISSSGVWILGSLNAGISDTLTIGATVDIGTADSTIVNTASVALVDQSDGNTANNSDSASITVESATGADLEVVKTVDDAEPNVGDTINYAVVLTNLGPFATTNVAVTDSLPAGVTFVSSAATNGSYDSGTGVWSLASLADAASDTLTLTATVDTASAGSTIVNTATVTASDELDSNPGNNSDTASITVESIDLAVVKSVDNGTPNEGDTIVYTVALTNNGPSTATTVAVTDVLPSGVTYVSDTATQGTYNSGTGVWSLASIAPAVSDTLTLTATVDAGTGGSTIVNTASVTGSAQVDVVPGNDSDTADITVQLADLGITKTVDDPNPDEGATIVYTVALTNNGPDTATNVAVTDLLPSGVTYVSDTVTQGSYTSGTGLWTVGSVANAASDTLTITATVDLGTAGQTIVNTASVTAADQADGNASNDSDTADIVVPGGLDLAVTKTVDDPAPSEGGTIVYTVALDNAGPDVGTNIEVTDSLPTGVTYVSHTATQGTYVTGTGVWSVPSLADGASDTLAITATVDTGTGGTSIVNTASVTAVDQIENNPANDSDSATINVPGADLAVVKTVDDFTPVEGTSVTYTVVLTNNGPDATTGISVTDSLPSGVSFVASSATQGSYNNGTGIWSVANLANGASDTLTIDVDVDAGTGGLTITNTATVTASALPDNNATNDSDSVDIIVLNPGSEAQITSVSSDARPCWSPDGLNIAFDSNRSGNRDVWRVPSTGGTATQLTVDTDVDQDPDWSPGDTTIVYRHGGATPDLWVIPSGGGTADTLDSDPTAQDRFPHYSPDGTQIAYEKDGQIFVIPATGGTPVAITADPGFATHPTWSPDGTQIAFISSRSGNNDIWVIPATGGTATQVTTHTGNDGACDWSPDGTTLAFQSNRSGNNDIWTIPATGGTATQITTAVGNDNQPDWSPSGLKIAFARQGNGLFVYSFPSLGSDLEVTKTVDVSFPNEGGTITYTVVVANNGPETATGVELTDALPTGVTYVSSTTTQGTYSDATGVWTVGSVSTSASATLTLTVTVDAGTGGSTITNIASITASDLIDTVPANNSDSADITVQSADLGVTKTVDDSTPNEGGTIVYTIALVNNGPFTAIGIEVTDALPTGVTYVSSTTTQGTYDDGTGVWSVGNMVTATNDTLFITATTDSGTGGSVITNTATITASNQADTNPTNDSDSVDITVQAATGAPVLGFIPTTYSLDHGRPNPFREVTTIPFNIPKQGTASLSIWDVTGRLVVNREVAPGRYQPEWDGRDESGRRVAAGLYFVRLHSGSFSATRKIIRLK
jgi:uncharacterized repeat protein (TIGR01451 family)